jgi:4-amino-4-deoxy-L-arabinose transferase-like glycosyltransferase
MLPPDLSGWSGFSKWGYSMFCAYLYAWFGNDTLVPRILNAAFSSLSILYVYRLGMLYFDRSVARLAVLLVAFLPFTMLVTLEMRKDPIVQFLALFILYHSAVMMKFDRRWPLSVALIGLAMVPMYCLRSAFIIPFFGLVAISIVAAQRNFLTAAAAAFPVMLLVGAFSFSVPEESKINLEANIQRLQAKVQLGQHQGGPGTVQGGLMRYAQISSPTQIWKMPLSATVILISPFPPALPPRFPHLLYHWTNLICLVLYPWLITGVISILREERLRERALLLLFPAVFLILIGAIHPSVTRYRETVFPIVLLLIAVGFHRRHNLLTSGLTYAGLGSLAAVVYAARLS